MSLLRRIRQFPIWLPALLVTIVCGCGADEYKVAPVHGRVLCNGQPVPGGVVYMSPIEDPEETGRRTGYAGKSGSAIVKTDGTFVIGTYSERDGALIGRHRISFEFPVLPSTDSGQGG